jgi:hypothetical protein
MSYAGKTEMDSWQPEKIHELLDRVGTLHERRSDDFYLIGNL